MQKEQLKTLESLRFIAFCMIFFHHLLYTTIKLGTSAVTFFFVLSGFVFAFAYRDYFSQLSINKLKKFYIARLSRVYPLHLLMFVISLPMIRFMPWEVNLNYAFFHVLLLHSYFPMAEQVLSFNGVSWFLSTLFFIYLLIPFVLFALQKMKIPQNIWSMIFLAVACFFIVILVGYLLRHDLENLSAGWWFIYISPYMRFFDFMIGLLTGLITLRFRELNLLSKIGSNLFTFAELLVLFSFGYMVYYTQFLSAKYTFLFYSSFFLPFSVLLVFVFSFQKGHVSTVLSNKLLVYLGSLSFTMFMIHSLFISGMVAYFRTTVMLNIDTYLDGHRMTSQLLLLFVIICVSDVVVRYYEAPLRQKIMSFFIL
ncbi:MAG TPA: acyltransferase [Anaerolineales bacterium]|nr:acyltransferase [Anaerolineales bacterium]